jgi:hypothetical protein
MQRKQSMRAQIEDKIGAVGEQGMAQEGFVSMARTLLPSLPEKQAELIFNSCDKDKSGVIGLAEVQSVLEKLIDLDSSSKGQAKGAKPLFATRTALARSKPRRLSLDDYNAVPTPVGLREREIRHAVDAATAAASSQEQRDDIQLVAQLLELGVPQPWPATLCHLVENIDGGPGAELGVGKELVRRIVAACWEDRMAVGEEVLVLQNTACNLWKKATIEAHIPVPDGKPGSLFDVSFALGQAEPIKRMPANNVLPIQDGGAGALLRAAALAGDNGLVQALLSAGVHVYESSPDGNTALHAAAGHGHAAVYKTLMDEAAKLPAIKGPPAHAFTKNVRGMRAFDYMVQGHHIRCTRYASVNKQAYASTPQKRITAPSTSLVTLGRAIRLKWLRHAGDRLYGAGSAHSLHAVRQPHWFILRVPHLRGARCARHSLSPPLVFLPCPTSPTPYKSLPLLSLPLPSG